MIFTNFVVQLQYCKEIINLLLNISWLITGLNHKLNYGTKIKHKNLIIKIIKTIIIDVWGACGRKFESCHPDC
jgi:hypothetical protein